MDDVEAEAGPTPMEARVLLLGEAPLVFHALGTAVLSCGLISCLAIQRRPCSILDVPNRADGTVARPEPRPGPGRADQPDRLQSLSRRGTHLSRLSEPTTVTVVVCQGQPNTAHVGEIHLGRRGRSPGDARAAKLRGPAVIPIGIDPLSRR